MNGHIFYHKNSAGAHMTTRIPKVSPSETIGGVQKLLREHSRTFETIDYIYVVQSDEKLLGILSIRELYHHDTAIRIGEVCLKAALITLSPSAHQERAAYLALKHHLKEIPLVDHNNGRLLGVIPSDVILAILYRETHEDLMRMAGVYHSGKDVSIDHILKISTWRSMIHRLPWLFLGLCGGLLTARIIGAFELTLEKNIILAAFIPLIVYMSDAVGTQMEAFIIRDIAIERSFKFGRYFFKQFTTTILIGFLFGGITALVTTVFFHDPRVGAVLGLSLVFAIASSIVSGLIIPFLFSKLKFDPANASGPIATIIQDIFSVAIYFSIASWLLG